MDPQLRKKCFATITAGLKRNEETPLGLDRDRLTSKEKEWMRELRRVLDTAPRHRHDNHSIILEKLSPEDLGTFVYATAMWYKYAEPLSILEEEGRRATW